MTAELSLPCFSYSQLNQPDGGYSLPIRLSAGTMVPGLRTEPELREPALPGHFTAEVARPCRHTRCSDYFLREQLCPRRQIPAPLRQGGSAPAGDGPFCKRLFIAASISYRRSPKRSCFFLETKFSCFLCLHIPEQQDLCFSPLVLLTLVSQPGGGQK